MKLGQQMIFDEFNILADCPIGWESGPTFLEVAKISPNAPMKKFVQQACGKWNFIF